MNTLIHYKNIDIKNVTFDGEKSQSGYLTNEEVKQIVLTHGQVNKDELDYYEDDLNVMDDQLIYMIKFKNESATYEYTINAVSGEIISFDIKE